MGQYCIGEARTTTQAQVTSRGSLTMNCPRGVFLLIVSCVDFRTKITKICATSRCIRRDMRNAALTYNDQKVSFDGVCNFITEKRNDKRSLAQLNRLLQYSVTAVSFLEINLRDYEDVGFRTLLVAIMKYGQNLKQEKIECIATDGGFAEILLTMIEKGFHFKKLHLSIHDGFKMTQLSWKLVQECTGLAVNFDQLCDQSNLKILSLPKLKSLCLTKVSSDPIVKEYSFPALETIILPSV